MKRSTYGALAALMLLTGTVAAAPDALADDRPQAANSVSTADAEETSRNHAADAHVETVAEAANAVRSATKLDLDIRLVAEKSVLVASDLL
ncbi:MAG: hypothetical protein WDZ50_06655 [Woeseia sp.]